LIEQLQAYMTEYDRTADAAANGSDEQRSLYNPLVFLLVGGGTGEALAALNRLMERKCANSAGVIYIHITYGEEETGEPSAASGGPRRGEGSGGAGNLFHIRLPLAAGERSTVRADLHRQFYARADARAILNRTLRQAASRLAAGGRLYANFERLSLAAVTLADDPLCILLPELTLATQSILGESFKQVQTDLYVLLREGAAAGDYAYASALGFSFLQELEQMQERGYTLKAPLLVTEDGFALTAQHGPSPLFDLVYLLGDKDSHGVLAKDGLALAYKAIAGLNLLKNRRSVHEYDGKSGGVYNNLQYKQSITSPAVPEHVYSSAGYAEVRRPNQAIALLVLKQVYQAFCAKLMSSGGMEAEQGIRLFGLDAQAIGRRAAELLPPRERLAELHALLAADLPLAGLKRSSLREAEDGLYGGNAKAFFTRHFTAAAQSALSRLNLQADMESVLAAELRPPYTFYSVYRWTDRREPAGLHHGLARQLEETVRQLDDASYALQNAYDQSGETLPGSGGFALLAGAGKKRFRRELLELLYGLHYEVLALTVKRDLLLKWGETLDALHESAGLLVGQLQTLAAELNEAGVQIAHRESEASGDYLGRNLKEYYGKQVERIIALLAAGRGAEFFLTERYFGDIAALLAAGRDKVLARLIEIGRRDVFTDAVFTQPFETELLERANVNAGFAEGAELLSREELYKDLFLRLAGGAAVRLALFHSTQKHRYEESYYFGDADSELIRYCLSRGDRTGQLGCVHERKTSGIDKLAIMGGFRLSDVMFWRNGRKYYDSYVDNGFQFHKEAVSDKGGPDASAE